MTEGVFDFRAGNWVERERREYFVRRILRGYFKCTWGV